MDIRSVPLRFHYDLGRSSVYQVVERSSLDSRALLCLIELIRLIHQPDYRFLLKVANHVLVFRAIHHPRLFMI